MTTCLLFSTFQTCLLERQWLLIIMAALPSDKKKKKSERGWWSNEELCLIIVVRQKEGLRDLSSFQKCCKTRFSSTVSKPTTYTQSHVHCNSTGTFEYIPDSAALLSMQGFWNRRGARGAIGLPRFWQINCPYYNQGVHYAHHITTLISPLPLIFRTSYVPEYMAWGWGLTMAKVFTIHT